MIRTISKFAEISAGINSTRIEGEFTQCTAADMEIALRTADASKLKRCLVNLISATASPYTEDMKQKVVTSNFAICRLNTSIVDPLYFCYALNENKELQTQKRILSQGRENKKLTLQNLEKLEFYFPPIEMQREIGKMYQKAIQLKYIQELQAKEIYEITMEIIEKEIDL